MKRLLIFISLVLFTNLGFTQTNSMRRCMILPITDSLGDSVGFKLYENVERYLKESKWCEYVSSAEIIGIFSKYRDQLDTYLQDEKVIKTVADRLRVGSIFRIDIGYDVDKMNLSLDVVGENGTDLYFSEKAVLNKIDLLQASTTIKNWLELYETNIPYDGKILGVLGDQITFSYAKSKVLSIGQDFKVKRFMNKKKHPLLKKIVEWDSEVIAKGKVFNLSRGQALGVIKVYTSNKKLKPGDWIRLEKPNPAKTNVDKNFSAYEKQKFGRLGEISLALSLSSHTVTTSAASGSNKMNGITYGINAEVETWITRNYLVMGEFSQSFGSLNKRSGSPSSSSTGQNMGTLKLAGGYKYLPMGFFYGPQVNIYAGYARYTYSLDTSAADGFGENSFSGLMLGLGGNIPIKKGIRFFASGEIMPFSSFNDTSSIFGSTKSQSSMELKVGANYIWAPNLKIRASFNVINNTAKFSGANSELSYSDTALRLGGTFTF